MNYSRDSKKIVAATLVLILLFSITSFVSFSATVISSGTCGKNLKWKLNSDGLLTISGTGKMYNYDSQYYIPEYKADAEVKISPFANRTDIKKIKIGSGVTSIGVYAFADCAKVGSVTIPNTVTSIGNYAFESCEKLKSVKIPSGVTKIGFYAFGFCTALEKISIPNSVKTIEMAFDGCTSLKQITIPASVTRIEEGVLRGCKKLTKITVAKGNEKYYSKGNCLIEKKTKTLLAGCNNSKIPQDGSIKTIGYCAFEDCEKLDNVVIPKGVKTIDVSAFDGCKSLKTVSMPSTLKKIETGVFYECYSLKSIVIPDGVIELGGYLFHNCKKLKKVWLPSSLVSIDGLAFENCKSLTDVYYGGTKAEWKDIEIDKYENDFLLKAKKHFSCCKTDGHSFETVKVKATTKKDGKIIKKCLICGKVEKKVIYKASDITLSKTYFVSNGKVQKPSVKVRDSKGKTIAKTNYTLTWSNAKSKDPDSYTVKVTLNGNYSGKKTLKYMIIPNS